MASKLTTRKSSLAALWKGNNVFLINIICPDNTNLSKVHSIRETVRDVITDSCKCLDINMPEIFGIALYENNEYRFISPKKSLHKFLPSATIVTSEQATKLNGIDTRMVLDSTIKSCRLYLRVKYFYTNVDVLSDRTLHHYYEQVKLDTLKYQNWFNLRGYTDVFHRIAAYALCLTYGCSTKNKLKHNQILLHYFLPQCERNENTIEMLAQLLKEISENAGICFIDFEENIEKQINNIPIKTKSISKAIDPSIPDIKVDEIIDDSAVKEFLMLSLIKEALTLPCYGVYYYHVTTVPKIKNEKAYTCKLGIGPFGASVAISPDYTTWEEVENWKWDTVDEINYDKNILDIQETSSDEFQTCLHQFECYDEKEAKYLFRELKASHLVQVRVLEKYRRRGDTLRKKRHNSIGVLSDEMASLALSPLIARSTSLMLVRGRSASALNLNEQKNHGEEQKRKNTSM